MYAISILLLFVAGKASRVPTVTSYFSSIISLRLELLADWPEKYFFWPISGTEFDHFELVR